MPISAREEAELFERLVELEDTERFAVLATIDLDPQSRASLQQLLEMERGAAEEFEQSVGSAMRLWGQSGVLEAGIQLGRFEVIRELGRGGMGEVWLVEFEEEGVRRRGALKVLRQHLMAPAQAALWDRERRLAARLSHPLIAGLIESGTLDNGMPFLLMEYVDGKRLDEAVEGMSLQGKIEVMRKVCNAVAAAHRQMVVHRDLKPSNILITPDGFPKLVDFGIGQALDLTQTHLGAGTRAYSSPEQMAGEEPSMAMDVFSLGRILERIVGEGAEDLNSIGKKASAIVATDRYGTVGEMEADLQRWLEKRPVRAHGDGLGYRLQCLVKRQPWATVGGAVAVVLTMLALVVAWKQYDRAQKRADDLRALAGVAIFDLDQEVRKLPGSMTARRMLLETATKYLADLGAAAKADRGLQAELADAYQKTSSLMFTATAQSLNRETEAFALIEKAYRLREALGQFESLDPKVRKAYSDTARVYSEKLRTSRRIEESDAVTAKLERHTEKWLRQEPRSWEALEHFLYIENGKTRRLRLKGLDLAIANQRKVLARLPELKQLGAPERNYWRNAAEQYRLMGGLLTDDSLAKLAPALLDSMTQGVRAAEEFYRIEPSVLSTRLLLTLYLEYVVQTVDMGMVMYGENERVIRRSEEILESPQLPDRDAAFWEQNRLELLQAKGWAAIGRKDYAAMERWFGECRTRLEKVEPQQQWWVGLLRGHMAMKEAEVKGRN